MQMSACKMQLLGSSDESNTTSISSATVFGDEKAISSRELTNQLKLN